MKKIIDLKNFLILLPLLMVFLTEVLWIFGIAVTIWSSWLIFASIIIFTGWLEKENWKKILLPFTGIFLFATFSFSMFLFQDSYDTSVCHRPAMIMIANGWNPIWQPTAEHLSSFGWDLSGLSINHILHQPKSFWAFGGVMYRMTGILTSEIILFVFFACSLFLYSKMFCTRFYSSSKIVSIIFSFSIIAMPQIAQALVGQLDYTVYAATVIAVFASMLFIANRNRADLLGAVVALLWLFTIKINGLMFAIVIFLCMAGMYLCIERQSWKQKLKKILILMTAFVVIGMIMNWNPYITNSIHLGGPLYPAHSFNKEKLQNVKDLTSDFVGNYDSEQMGHIGRFSYAWLSKSATLSYYRWKTGKADFYPTFNVAEGCEGYKTVFRVLMLLGLISLFFSKRKMGDYAALIFILLAFLLPTKYIGYSRYSPQIYCAPFVMLLSLYSSLNNETVKKWKRVILYIIPCCFLIYAGLVMGRFSGICLYSLYRSEKILSAMEEMKPESVVYTIKTIPMPEIWNASHISAYPMSKLVLHSWFSYTTNKEQYENTTFLSEKQIDLPLRENEYLLLYHHGVILKDGTYKEFSDSQKVQIPTSVSALKTIPYLYVVKQYPHFLVSILKLRFNKMFGCE